MSKDGSELVFNSESSGKEGIGVRVQGFNEGQFSTCQSPIGVLCLCLFVFGSSHLMVLDNALC